MSENIFDLNAIGRSPNGAAVSVPSYTQSLSSRSHYAFWDIYFNKH